MNATAGNLVARRDRVTVGSVRLSVGRHGTDGPWITLVHGGLVGSWGWRQQLPSHTKANLLSAGRLLVYDQRGYGSSSSDGPHDIQTLASDLVELWQACAIERTIVVGFSLGSFVALDAAARAPERVAGIVLEGCAEPTQIARDEFQSRALELETDNHALMVHDHVQAAFSAGFAADQPELIDEYTMFAKRVAPTALADSFRSIADWRIRDEHLTLGAATLIVCGERDRLFGPVPSRTMAERLSRAESVTILGAGHTAHLECAGAFNHLVVDFVERIEAGW